MRKRARKKKRITELVSKANLDKSELRRQVQRVDDSERTLDRSTAIAIVGEDFAKEPLKAESESSASEAVLYKENVLAVLRQQTARCWSQNVLISWRNMLKGTRGPFSTLRGQNRQREVRERVLASRSGEVWWKSELNQLPSWFVELIRIRFDKRVKSPKSYQLATRPVYAMWMSCIRR